MEKNEKKPENHDFEDGKGNNLITLQTPKRLIVNFILQLKK